MFKNITLKILILKTKKPKEKKIISKKKLISILLITLGAVIVTSILLLILITKFSVKEYPEDIKPSEEFCIEGYFFLPNHYKIQSTIPTKVEIKNKTTIFNRYDIFSNKICFKPTTLLKENNKYFLNMSYLGKNLWGIFEKEISISTTDYPKVKEILFEERINNDQILQYEIDYSDILLEYNILLDEKSVVCEVDSSTVLCDITDLELQQGNNYSLELVAKYENEIVKELGRTDVEILKPVEIVDSSIKEKEVIQSLTIPEIVITLNKEIEESFEISLRDKEDNVVNIESSLNESKKLIVNPKDEFKQNTSYFLKINNLTGLDGSHLNKEYVLEFSIDDGPQIQSSNIVKDFSTSGNIVLTFNQNLKESQNIKSFVKLSFGDYSYSINRNTLTINPNNNFNACKSYTLSIYKGITSNNSLISSKSTSYTINTYCKRSVSIGTSVQGRSIYATYFGTGSKKIIFYAAMHGSEYNTKALLNKWITELDNNRNSIPSDKTIIVIPTLNPDGIANSSRFNANSVDLNRNFDNASWVTGTYFLNNFYENGGGSEPFSEPESRAIRNLIVNQSPYLTISYHSAASYVIPSNTSNGISLARTYSQLSGYSYVSPGAEGSFTYDITGTFLEWAEENGYNGLTVELATPYYDEFSRNQKAMWEMVKN